MPQVGHSSSLKVSGAAVAVTGEATTALVAGVTYQITNTAKRIVDPNTAIVVNDGGVPVAATGYSFNYLFGKVTFVAPPAGAVTIDCSYLPVAAIAEVREFKLAGNAGLVDSTSFDSAGARSKIATLLDSSGDFSMLSLPLDDIDPVTGGVQTLHTTMTTGAAKLLQIILGAYYIRAWVKLSDIEVTGTVGDLVQSTASFEGAPQAAGAVLEISLP